MVGLIDVDDCVEVCVVFVFVMEVYGIFKVVVGLVVDFFGEVGVDSVE